MARGNTCECGQAAIAATTSGKPICADCWDEGYGDENTRAPDSAPEQIAENANCSPGGEGLVGELTCLGCHTSKPGPVDPSDMSESYVKVPWDLRDRILTALRASDRDSVIEECAKVAHGAGLSGDLGDWDKGWNYAAVTIGQRIRDLKGNTHD